MNSPFSTLNVFFKHEIILITQKNLDRKKKKLISMKFFMFSEQKLSFALNFEWKRKNLLIN